MISRLRLNAAVPGRAVRLLARRCIPLSKLHVPDELWDFVEIGIVTENNNNLTVGIDWVKAYYALAYAKNDEERKIIMDAIEELKQALSDCLQRADHV
jgi:hypothetical protein